ncbi:DUF6712 family protein [uncultured Prevotella sp.]|uniref:DUF6712 family protein n=1 Tax=uncultured Prevotella sp. TaxID=159272 RepID=UPI00345B1380
MYQRISAIEFSILCIGEYPIPSIIDIVNSIRLAKGNVFAEWKQSDTAKLFEDHGYKKRRVEGISSENQMRFRKIIVFLRKQNKIYGTIQIRFFQKGAQRSDHECCYTLQSRM